MWEVWPRSVAPQRGSLLSLMPADRYRIRPSVELSYCYFTSMDRMHLTSESASVRRAYKLWILLMPSICHVQLFVSFSLFPTCPRMTPRKSWTFPVNLWLICDRVSLNLDIEYFLKDWNQWLYNLFIHFFISAVSRVWSIRFWGCKNKYLSF